MLLRAEDSFGRINSMAPCKLRHILDLIDGYMKVPYVINEIRQDDINDKNGRIDIEVRFLDENKNPIQQKLLILNDELIDGETFHKRFKEWY